MLLVQLLLRILEWSTALFTIHSALLPWQEVFECDQHLQETLWESMQRQPAWQTKWLFGVILPMCQPANTRELWNYCYNHMVEDLVFTGQKWEVQNQLIHCSDFTHPTWTWTSPWGGLPRLVEVWSFFWTSSKKTQLALWLRIKHTSESRWYQQCQFTEHTSVRGIWKYHAKVWKEWTWMFLHWWTWRCWKDISL